MEPIEQSCFQEEGTQKNASWHLLGIPTTAARAYTPVRSDRNRWNYDFFITDEWKVNQKLTLTIGARYELHKPWRENNDFISLFDIGTGSVVVPDGALSKINPLYPADFAPVIEAKMRDCRAAP